MIEVSDRLVQVQPKGKAYRRHVLSNHECAGPTQRRSDCRKNIGEKMIDLIELVRRSLRRLELTFIPGAQRCDQMLRGLAVLAKTFLRVVGRGASGDDELPV